METLFAWILGIALMLLVVFIPIAWISSIRESYKNADKGTRKSYRRGWTNKSWK